MWHLVCGNRGLELKSRSPRFVLNEKAVPTPHQNMILPRSSARYSLRCPPEPLTARMSLCWPLGLLGSRGRSGRLSVSPRFGSPPRWTASHTLPYSGWLAAIVLGALPSVKNQKSVLLERQGGLLEPERATSKGGGGPCRPYYRRAARTDYAPRQSQQQPTVATANRSAISWPRLKAAGAPTSLNRWRSPASAIAGLVASFSSLAVTILANWPRGYRIGALACRFEASGFLARKAETFSRGYSVVTFL